MLEQLGRLGFQKIIVVDNCSTYGPMLNYLEQIAASGTIRVQLLPTNRGGRVLSTDPEMYKELPELFCITDPDIQFNPNLPPDFLSILVGLTEQYGIGKAGFALDITHRELLCDGDMIVAGKRYKVWEWEEQFWRQPLGLLGTGDPVYLAQIDTTFALYNKRFFNPAHHLRAVRVAGRFTARHLPWFQDWTIPAEEEAYYRNTAKFSEAQLHDGEFALHSAKA